jgi:hypothetical protein
MMLHLINTLKKYHHLLILHVRFNLFLIVLLELYKVTDICYNNNEMDKAPILIEIVDRDIKQHFDGKNYLL